MRARFFSNTNTYAVKMNEIHAVKIIHTDVIIWFYYGVVSLYISNVLALASVA